MKIKYVTMTGADDKTSIDGMEELSGRFEFAEWGILFSQDKASVSRYPSLDWVEGLFHHTQRYCAHLCGKWVSDAMKLGVITFLNNDDMLDLFGRVQLNMGKERLRSALDPERGELLWQGLSDSTPFILGGNYPDTVDPRLFFMSEVCPIFDASGGDLTKEWRAPWVVDGESIFCGYAGGLSPENLEEQLFLIEKVCEVKETEIWIDAESGLRNDKDEFDLGKCEQFLEIAKSWTG